MKLLFLSLMLLVGCMPIKVVSPVENTQLATHTSEPKKEEAPYVRGVDQDKENVDDDRNNDNHDIKLFSDIETCNDRFDKLNNHNSDLMSEIDYLYKDIEGNRALARDLEQQNAALRSQLQVLMGR